ncbi:MAG: dihydroorotate dehydrogenase [Acidobacteriota bacterium]|nr:MAG: dihydroorotate dehydrogenase [Acidobacteriota bacterium]
MSPAVRTAVDLGRGLVLRNPLLTASGTFGYGLEFEPFLDLARLGGIVVKGISPKERSGNAPARIIETPSGMLNAIGLQNIGVMRFVQEKLPALRERDTALIVNVFGNSIDDYVTVVEQLEAEEGIAALELNLSCPNVEEGGLEIGRSPRSIEQVTHAVRQRTRRALWVKLTPNVSDISETARAAVSGGADAVSLVNTYVGMVIDVERRRPVLSHGHGGLSGPAIRPLAIAAVYQVCQAVDVPVIGIGGIVAARDVVEFMMAGARAVQVGTANYNDPAIAAKLVDGLVEWCAAHEVADVNQLVGAAQQ